MVSKRQGGQRRVLACRAHLEEPKVGTRSLPSGPAQRVRPLAGPMAGTRWLCPPDESDTPLLNLLHHPFVDHAGDVEIVLLDHHHMAVAANALVLQADVFGLDAGLIEVLRGAVIV